MRITDIGQGKNPVRIVSMRALPDLPTDKELVKSFFVSTPWLKLSSRYPREEWIDQGTNNLQEQQDQARKEGRDIDQSGDYVVRTILHLNTPYTSHTGRTGSSPFPIRHSLVKVPIYVQRICSR